MITKRGLKAFSSSLHYKLNFFFIYPSLIYAENGRSKPKELKLWEGNRKA
jgi:hypothetical protein